MSINISVPPTHELKPRITVIGVGGAGCNAVKFQKRTPEIATPKSSWDVVRDTPWGKMKYID